MMWWKLPPVLTTLKSASHPTMVSEIFAALYVNCGRRPDACEICLCNTGATRCLLVITRCLPQSHSAARRIMSMKKFNDIIGNQTRNLPACSAVSQPTAPPRAPKVVNTLTKIRSTVGITSRRFGLCILNPSQLITRINALWTHLVLLFKCLTCHRMLLFLFWSVILILHKTCYVHCVQFIDHTVSNFTQSKYFVFYMYMN
jgi:hypothetical protein